MKCTSLPLHRREFITLLGAATAWPLAVRAQQPERVRRIGVLLGYGETDMETQARITALRRKLDELGWREGRNLRIDYRFVADAERMRAGAADLVGLAPDVIVASPGQVLLVLTKQTRTIPIVFANVPDPVGIGLVPSLAHPGGNITGFTSIEPTLAGKWLEALKEVAPYVTRTAVIYNPANPAWRERLRVIQTVAPSLVAELNPVGVGNAAEIERALDGFAREPNGGLIVLPSLFMQAHRKTVIALAAKHRMPAIYPFRYFATDGGLISYGIDTLDQFRGAATYVDRILRGEKPADLPVQAPVKYELVINLKTAKALGLEVPPTLLARADEVIE
jgi:putative ABC transport system substrate-binding protein